MFAAYLQQAGIKMLKISTDIDIDVRKSDVGLMVRRKPAARILHIPGIIGEQGLDAAAGINIEKGKLAAKPIVVFWDKEQSFGVVMTEETEARLRRAAAASSGGAVAEKEAT
jgi:hypothetical protein